MRRLSCSPGGSHPALSTSSSSADPRRARSRSRKHARRDRGSGPPPHRSRALIPARRTMASKYARAPDSNRDRRQARSPVDAWSRAREWAGRRTRGCRSWPARQYCGSDAVRCLEARGPSSSAHAGCVKSPVPTAVMPWPSARHARCSMSRSRPHARGNLEWICRSAWNMRSRSALGRSSDSWSGRRPENWRLPRDAETRWAGAAGTALSSPQLPVPICLVWSIARPRPPASGARQDRRAARLPGPALACRSDPAGSDPVSTAWLRWSAPACQPAAAAHGRLTANLPLRCPALSPADSRGRKAAPRRPSAATRRGRPCLPCRVAVGSRSRQPAGYGGRTGGFGAGIRTSKRHAKECVPGQRGALRPA